MEDPNSKNSEEISFSKKPVQPSTNPINFQNSQNNTRVLIQPR